MEIDCRCEKSVDHDAITIHSQPQPSIDGGLRRAAALQEFPDYEVNRIATSSFPSLPSVQN